MDFIENFSSSVKLWWSKKYFWWFGLILAVLTNTSSFTSNWSNLSETSVNNPGLFLAISIGFLCLSLIILILIVYLGNVATAGLIKAVSDELKGISNNFKSAFNFGRTKWVKLFLLNLIIFSPLLIFIGILVACFVTLFLVVFGISDTAVFYGQASSSSVLVQLPEFRELGSVLGTSTGPEEVETITLLFLTVICCLGLPIILFIGVLLGIIKTYASQFVVLNNEGIIDSIKLAYELFRENLSISLLTWFLILLVSLVISFTLFIPNFFFGMILLLASTSSSIIVILLIFILTGFLSIALSSAISGPFTALNLTYWTKTFMMLTNSGTAAVAEKTTEQSAQNVLEEQTVSTDQSDAAEQTN